MVVMGAPAHQKSSRPACRPPPPRALQPPLPGCCTTTMSSLHAPTPALQLDDPIMYTSNYDPTRKNNSSNAPSTMRVLQQNCAYMTIVLPISVSLAVGRCPT